MPADRAIAVARTLVGTPFRFHGRTADGVDCVGLVALAYGREQDLPSGYAMRNSATQRWIETVDRHARRRDDGMQTAGDIVMLQVGPAQIHLGIWTGAGLIHADARLRCVVELPGPLPWPIIASWHAPEED